MLRLHLQAAYRTMSARPTFRLAFSSSVAIPLTRPTAFSVSLVRPLRLTVPRRLCSSSVNLTAVTTSPSLSPSGNAVAVAAGFNDAPILDDTVPTLSPGPADPTTLIESVPEATPEVEDFDPTNPPISSFRLSPKTIERLKRNEITHATEVQYGTFDTIFDGKDLIAKSRTGTGKTLAFALPIMERLAISRKEKGRRQRGESPSCIVLAPTRELAKQVAREMTNIGEGLDLTVECFYGGSAYPPQENALRRGLDVVVGTPGRVMDHMQRGTLRMENIQFAVLDEADEMLNMGFAQDVEQIFATLPPKEERQVILFSATVPSWVKGLASQYQNKDVVMFDSVTTGSMAATTVRHCAVRVPEREEARAGLLADIIAVHSRTKHDDSVTGSSGLGVAVLDGDGRQEVGPSRAIVFTQTKREADELATSGALDGCGAAVLHGDVTQRQREVTLSQFRKGKFQVLVATDVAARGLDITGVDVVIQYRVPRDSESYIHRAGRTGRAGKSGTAVVMYSDKEANLVRTLERECRIKFEQEAAPAPEMALEAAVDVTLCNLWTVDPRVRKHLTGRAAAIGTLDSEERTETIAALLAVAGRRTRLEDRSVLSGEAGMRTLVVRDTGSEEEVNSGRVMRFVNTVGRNLFTERVDVGLIRLCRDGSAVVDISSDQAEKLLEASKQADSEVESLALSLELAVGLPALKDSYRRSGGGYGTGRRGDTRGGYMGGMRRGGSRDFDRRRGGGGGGGGYREDRMGSRRGGYAGRGGERQDRGGGGSFGREEHWSNRGRRSDSGERGSDRFGGADRNERYGGGDRDNRRGGQGGASRGRRTSQFLENEF